MLKSVSILSLLLVILGLTVFIVTGSKIDFMVVNQPYLPKIYCLDATKTNCDVRLTTSIGNPEEYREVLTLLDQAKRGDQIQFYLAGNGGRLDSTFQLINSIQNTKAHVTMIVQGDIFSAHSMLALSGDKIIVHKYGMIQFHRSSGYGQEKGCNKYEHKLDRTQSMKLKCLDDLRKHLTQDEKVVRLILGKVLTQSEVDLVLKGHDIILSMDEVNSRLFQKGFRPR